MKHMPLLFIFSSFILAVGCQESTKVSSSNQNSYCAQNPYAYGCSGSSTGYTTGYTTGGATGTTVGGTTSGSTTGGTTGNPFVNPYPNYYSQAVSKNWGVLYPFIPSVSCSTATAPSGISYTPYETRKGTITLKGKVDYDPSSGQAFLDTTSELLRSTNGARNFFWGDSTLKIRFVANVQPESRNTTSVCPGRVPNQSSMRGYGRLKFDLYLVGKPTATTESTVSLGTKVVNVNSCTPAIDLSPYAEQYPYGIYLKIRNVRSNQNWLPGGANYWDSIQQATVDSNYGYIYPQNPYVGETWNSNVREAECWSLDIEVAADGTKTFN